MSKIGAENRYLGSASKIGAKNRYLNWSVFVRVQAEEQVPLSWRALACRNSTHYHLPLPPATDRLHFRGISSPQLVQLFRGLCVRERHRHPSAPHPGVPVGLPVLPALPCPSVTRSRGAGGKRMHPAPSEPSRALPVRPGRPRDASRGCRILRRPGREAREAPGCRPHPPCPPHSFGTHPEVTQGCRTCPAPSILSRALPASHGRPRDASRGCRILRRSGREAREAPGCPPHPPCPPHSFGTHPEVTQGCRTCPAPSILSRALPASHGRPRDASRGCRILRRSGRYTFCRGDEEVSHAFLFSATIQLGHYSPNLIFFFSQLGHVGVSYNTQALAASKWFSLLSRLNR